MELGYKFRIYPNASQRELITKTFGCTRFVYNYFLAHRIKTYKESGKTPTAYDQAKLLTQMKNELVWLKEVDATAFTTTLQDLDIAYRNFFRRIKSGEQNGFPKFKSKKSRYQSYRSRNNELKRSIRIEGSYIRIPKLGRVRCRVSRAISGRILNATITLTPSGRYYVSVCCTEVNVEPTPKTGNIIGVDMGIKSFAVSSDGASYVNPHYFENSEKRIARAQRNLARKTRGSRNWEKSRKKLAKLHEHVVNQRCDMSHKLSTEIIKRNDVVCIEDLATRGLMQNHRLAKSISDVAWRMFRKQLEYKSELYDKRIVVVGKYFPSSQLCSSCGAKWDMTKDLRVREWICPECGAKHDRDVNAAINILNEGLRLMA